jgi:hypothetical protein
MPPKYYQKPKRQAVEFGGVKDPLLFVLNASLYLEYFYPE